MFGSKRKTLALLAIVTAAGLTGISFAETSGTASVAVSTSGAADGSYATVTSAGTDGANGQAPSWQPIVGAAGQIPDGDNQAGDLYLVNTSGYQGDLLVTLYLNNPADLSKAYSYLNLGVTAYEWDATLNGGSGDWKQDPVAGVNATGSPDTFLTLTNGYVQFRLTQSSDGGLFSIGIDEGSFYATSSDTGTLDPQFFVDVKPA